MTAVTSPCPKCECIIAWPLRYLRVRSYGDAVFDLPIATEVFTPRLNVLDVAQTSQTAQVILPCLVAVWIRCVVSTSHAEHIIVIDSPIEYFSAFATAITLIFLVYLPRLGLNERKLFFAIDTLFTGDAVFVRTPPKSGSRTRSTGWPVSFSIARIECSSAVVKSVIARPLLPARPVRPMR